MNPYETLGVPKDATQDTIKKAYRKKAQKKHPDRGGTEEEFKDLSTAYRMVSNPESRARYDACGDSEIPNVDAKARSLAIQAVIQFIEAGHSNYLLEATRAIQVLIQKSNADIKEVNNKLASFEKYCKRLKPLGADTFLLEALKSHQQQYEGKIVTLNDQINVFNKALEFLTMFELEGIEPESQQDAIARMLGEALGEALRNHSQAPFGFAG